MRGHLVIIVLVLILPMLQPGPSSPVEEVVGTHAGVASPSIERITQVQLSEVCPGRPVEYVILLNQGDAISLNGTVLTDGEGSITVKADLVLPHGGSIALTSNSSLFQKVHPNITWIGKGSPLLSWGGRFALADGGDSVSLLIGGRTVDTMVYGSIEYAGEGWSGPPIGPVPAAHSLVRVGGDHDTADDWNVEPPGRSSLSQETWSAIVEPFSAPENAGARLVRELNMAARTVNCSVYELTDPAVVSALARCSRRGIDVNVLLEGQPVGGLSNASLRAISTLQASKVDVHIIRSVDSYKRYDYLHAKYMVVDGRRAVVMSENWGSGLYSNRGWGVSLDGVEVGSYFDEVFRQDFSGTIDITTPTVDLPTLDDVPPSDIDLDDLVRYRCQVSSLLSPDYSGAVLHELLTSAQERILIEQLSVEKDWLGRPGLIADIVSAAARGVMVRLLLDASWGGKENKVVVDSLNSLARSNGLDLEATLITEYHDLSVMHNKGIIVDDKVAVSSINWGDSAVLDNREAGAIISSSEITSYFAKLFWSDWSVDPIPPIAELPWTYLSTTVGDVVMLDGTRCDDNSGTIECEWDLESDGTIDNRSTTWAVRLPQGNHTILLTVRDRGNNSASAVCWVMVAQARTPDQGSLPLLLIAPISVVGGLYALKRIIGRKRH